MWRSIGVVGQGGAIGMGGYINIYIIYIGVVMGTVRELIKWL